MARTIWSGSLSFGLVNIPVNLVSAVVDRGLHFHLLHDKDGARIQEQRICSKDSAVVTWEHTVKGYEVAKGHYVEVTDDELDTLAPKKSRAIDLESFVPLDQINPIYFQHPYYLVPAQGADGPYALMREVIAVSNRVGIARMVMRGKESLVALRAIERALSLSVLWFADEVVRPESLEGVPKAAKAPANQLALAQQIVKSLSEDFHPEKYKDDFRARVLELVHKKSKGETIPEAKEAPAAKSNVLDLMGALRASLEQGNKPNSRKANAPAQAKRKKAHAKLRRAG